jgi:hypothetical protein
VGLVAFGLAGEGGVDALGLAGDGAVEGFDGLAAEPGAGGGDRSSLLMAAPPPVRAFTPAPALTSGRRSSSVD